MKPKNHVDLIGFVGRDPKVSYRDDHTVFNVRFTLATTDRWTDVTGSKRERTEWHRIVFWDRLAEHVAKLVRSGSLLEVEGSLQSSTYDKDGVVHTAWEIRGREFRLFDRAHGDAAGAPSADAPEPPDQAVSAGDDMPL